MKEIGEFISDAMIWIKKIYQKAISRIVQAWRQIMRPNAPVARDEEIQSDLAVSGVRSRLLVKPRHKPIRRRSRERVYRLKGYTTVAKVNRRRQSERHQRILRRILVTIIVILLIILLFNLYNPFKDLSEWYRIIGIKDISELTNESLIIQTTTTTQSTSTTQSTTSSVVQ